NPRKTKDYVLEAKNKGVKVHHPDINISQSLYILRNGEIYFGLSCIKSLRKNFLQDILQERKRSGIFKNMEDFLQRINKRYLKRELIEILIYSGVFDTFGQSRKELLAMLPRLLSNIELSGNNVELFSILAPKKTTVEKIEISNDEL
ncbi:UNVERIFIED_CONTAM: DNA polymerase III subunit alpha, partial [Lactobacillus acidophilus]|nr:DNA polymerase III subunit alpha [Lactobacillus acidophilus]